jgi:hypothetical protein
MRLPLGQILRLSGLVVEIPCVLGLLSLRQGKLGDWSKSPVDPATVLSIGIGAGFVLWIVGTIMSQWPQPRKPPIGRE